MTRDKGILYIATGNTHVSEAIESAQRVRELNVECGISLVSDRNPKKDDLFDTVINLSDPEYGFADKPVGMRRTPYNRTIYLDSDTYVITTDGLTDLFETLEHYDLCGALDSARSLETLPGEFDLPDVLVDVPNTFTWINTGVLAFDTEAVSGMLDDWVKYHEQLTEMNQHRDPYGRGLTDQAAFRWALFDNDVDFHVTPPEYNFRLPYPTSVHDPVHILHGNADNMECIAELVNRNRQEYRQFLPRRWAKDDSLSSTNTYELCLHLLGRLFRPLIQRWPFG